MQSDIYAEYALIESKISQLEAEKDRMKPLLLEDMISKGVKTEDRGYGKFSVKKFTTWKFPERIVKLEEEVKVEKEKAKSTGEAEKEERDIFSYTAAKL